MWYACPLPAQLTPTFLPWPRNIEMFIAVLHVALVAEEVREAILKPPTVEDVHMYPLREISNRMASVDTSNDKERLNNS